jgi:hypothetical protein
MSTVPAGEVNALGDGVAGAHVGGIGPREDDNKLTLFLLQFFKTFFFSICQ